MLLAMLLGQWLHESYLAYFEAVAGLLIVPELVAACFAIVVFILAFTSDHRQRTDSRLAAMGSSGGRFERVADAVAILRPNGQLLSAPVDELKRQIRELSFAETKPKFLDGLVVLSESETDGRTKRIVENPSAEQIASLRNAAGVTNFEEREPGLEEVYFAVLRGSAATNP